MRNKNIIGIVVLVIIFIIGFNLLKQKGLKQDIGESSELIAKRNTEKIIVHNETTDKDDAKDETSKEISRPASKGVAPKEHENLDLKLLFSPEPIEESVVYEVKPGDTLSAIAKKFRTTIDLIKTSNKLEGSIIKVGQRLKIIKGGFKIVIDTSNNTLLLFLDDKLVKIYPVGTAKYRNTPIGEFKITNKLIDPTWYAPEGGVYPFGDPNNIIGTRWMGIDEPGYGIHGTADPESIGKYVSRGCVRMLNEDVEELFTIVPIGTKVNIIKSKEG